MGDAENTEPRPPDPLDFDPRAEEDIRKPRLMARDPVCGVDVDPEGDPARSVYRGTAYYFCTLKCKSEFDFDPSRYVGE
jgi:YHS domain-containing protein